MNNINTRLPRESRRSGTAPRPSFGVNRPSDNLRARVKSVNVINQERASKLSATQEKQADKYINNSSRTVKVKAKKRKLSLTKLSISFLLLIIVTLTLINGSEVITNSFASKSSDKLDLAARVSNLIKLEDANPKIYKVGDVASLKSKSAFYEAVMPGDYVLVYNQDQKVLIYRESVNLIINIDTVSNL